MVSVGDKVSWRSRPPINGPTLKGVVFRVHPAGDKVIRSPHCMVRTDQGGITVDYVVLLSNYTLEVRR